jgi:hypothetical protein
MTYRLPDGLYTDNPVYYTDRWAKVCKPFEDLGFRIVAIDPSIQISKGGGVFTIPIEIANRIIKLEEELKEAYGEV